MSCKRNTSKLNTNGLLYQEVIISQGHEKNLLAKGLSFTKQSFTIEDWFVIFITGYKHLFAKVTLISVFKNIRKKGPSI